MKWLLTYYNINILEMISSILEMIWNFFHYSTLFVLLCAGVSDKSLSQQVDWSSERNGRS